MYNFLRIVDHHRI